MKAGAMTKAGGMPSMKLLLVLGGLVMLTHLLVLQGSPLRFGGKLQPGKPAARAFATRAIEAPPAVEAPPVTPAQPVVRPAKPRRVSRSEIPSNVPVAPEKPAPLAIDTIATDPATLPVEVAATSVSGSPTQPLQQTRPACRPRPRQPAQRSPPPLQPPHCPRAPKPRPSQP